jgi:hypothetical protein
MDWFLPSLFEFSFSSLGLKEHELGLVPNESYWTSTQGTHFMGTDPDAATLAFMIRPFPYNSDEIINIEVLLGQKNSVARVRPIRAF